MEKLMFKSLIAKRGFINYLFISILLFSLLIFLINAKISVNKLVFENQNDIKYRTIVVKFKSEDYFEIIKMNDFVEKIESEDNLSFNIVIKKYNYVNSFLEKYDDFFSYTEVTPYASSKIIIGIGNLLNLVISVIFIIVFLLTFLNINDLAFSEKKDISLYKLIGYDNRYLLKILFQILIMLHIFLYFLGLIVSILLTIFSNYALIFNEINLYIPLINVNVVVYLFVFIFVVLVCSILILYLKIKKITPIILFKCS